MKFEYLLRWDFQIIAPIWNPRILTNARVIKSNFIYNTRKGSPYTI